MKQNNKTPKILVVLLLFMMSMGVNAQLDLPRGSQMAKVSQRVGITDVTIKYSRPSVNDREVWGKLVPYGMNNLGFGTAKESPWRAGANENTIIHFSDDAKVEGKAISAGKYGLHMIVHEDGKATIIFSKDHSSWGSYFYSPENDALRVDVNSTEVPHTELLTFNFIAVDKGSTTAALSWGKKQIPFKIEVDVPSVVITDIEQKLQNSQGFNRQSWEQAANFALNNDGDLDKALYWINAAIEGQFFSQKNYNNLSIKSKILEKQGKSEEAEKLMNEALPMASVFQVHNYGRQLIKQDKKEKALEIFKKNAKMNKGKWPVDFGLARGYAAIGNYKTALKHLKIAQKRAPDKINKDAIEGYLVDLQNGKDIN